MENIKQWENNGKFPTVIFQWENTVKNLMISCSDSSNTMVKVGDGNLLPVAHTSTFGLPTRHKPLTLTNVLHVPKLQHNFSFYTIV